MSTDETYNGWTNRETWAVALWIDNDQGMQESVLELVQDEWTAGHLSADQPHRAGEVVREYVADLFDWSNYGDEHGGQVVVPRVLLTMMEDIGSLYRVEWAEVGAHYLQTVVEMDSAGV